MSTLTKAKKTARSPQRPAARSAAALPPIPTTSPLYGRDSAIGCVSIAVPRSHAARRAVIRERSHADNHR